LIVRAVNAHDGLVAALANLVAALDEARIASGWKVLAEARAALEGGENG
jgi:hypothetical protein